MEADLPTPRTSGRRSRTPPISHRPRDPASTPAAEWVRSRRNARGLRPGAWAEIATDRRPRRRHWTAVGCTARHARSDRPAPRKAEPAAGPARRAKADPARADDWQDPRPPGARGSGKGGRRAELQIQNSEPRADAALHGTARPA